MTSTLVIFDLDGTLAESKQPVSADMATKLAALLSRTNVAIVSGGTIRQIRKQLIDHLPHTAPLSHLYLLPTSGAALYEHTHDHWKKIFEERLKAREVEQVIEALRSAAEETGLIDFTEKAWGERIENRGSQVTLSALGQKAPLALKKLWDPSKKKRHALQAAAQRRLLQFEVGMGGSTSIDVSKKGVDKAYGVRKLCDRLGIKETDALYIGDELEKGGNDEPIFKTEVPTKSVSSPADTATVIDSLL